MSTFVEWARELLRRAQEYESKKKGRIAVKAAPPALSKDDYELLAQLDKAFRD